MADAFPSVFDTLSPDIAKRAKRLVAQREVQGLNIHFFNERGQLDRFSFATLAAADSFRIALGKRGLKPLY